MRNKAIIALVIANVIWGGASPIFKWSLTNIPPFTLAFWRFGLASLLLFPFVLKNFLKVKRSDLLKVFLFGLSGVTFNITFFFLGLELSPSINSAIIGTTQPIMLLLIGALFLKEKIETHELLGTLISFAGILTIIILPFLANGFKGEIMALGNLFFVLATLGAVGQAYFGKKLFVKYETLPMTFWSFAIGTVSFLPFFVWENSNGSIWLSQLALPGFFGVIYGAFLSSALAYSLYDWGLSKIEASEAGIFTYLMPVTATALAVTFFGEKITSQFVWGAILIILGISVAQIHLHKKSQI